MTTTTEARSETEGRVLLLRLSICAWTASAAGVGVTIMYLTKGARIAAAETALMVVGIELSRRWACRRPDGSRVVAGTHLWMGIGGVTMVANAFTVGLDQAVTMWFFCAVPMLAAHLATVRAATKWLVITLAAFAVVHSVHLFVDIPQEFIPTGTERLVAQLVMATALYLFGVGQRQTVMRQLAVIRGQAEELEVARDKALSGSKAKSDFLANMSHELRTPLHGVLASLDLIDSSELSPSARAHIAAAVASAEHAQEVVDAILDFTKLEAKAMDRDDVVFDVALVVRQAVAVVEPIAIRKHLNVRVTVDVAPSHLVGDANKLRQVLVNLLSNATKFTEHGEVEVRVRHGEGDLVEFDVTDTGIGMNADDLRRVFEKFEQADTSTTRAYGGTGLGLTISRGLSELLGGEIRVQSTPGKGSTFTLSVPLPAAPPEAVAVNLAPLRSKTIVTGPQRTIQGPAGGPLVLVVDDNDLNGEIACDMLEALGCRSKWVGDGRQALTAVDELRTSDGGGVDGVLLDLHMPGMHGTEVARELRARTTPGRPLAIVGLTADVSGEAVPAAIDAGMDLCLAKPARLAELRDALDQVGLLSRGQETVLLMEARRLIDEYDSATDLDHVRNLLTEARARSEELVNQLRRDEHGLDRFHRAHGHLAGNVVYADELVRRGQLDGERRQLVLRCLDRAIEWDRA